MANDHVPLAEVDPAVAEGGIGRPVHHELHSGRRLRRGPVVPLLGDRQSEGILPTTQSVLRHLAVGFELARDRFERPFERSVVVTGRQWEGLRIRRPIDVQIPATQALGELGGAGVVPSAPVHLEMHLVGAIPIAPPEDETFEQLQAALHDVDLILRHGPKGPRKFVRAQIDGGSRLVIGGEYRVVLVPTPPVPVTVARFDGSHVSVEPRRPGREDRGGIAQHASAT